MDDSSVLQQAISYDIPHQRVLIKRPVLLGRHDLLCISRKSRTSQCSANVLLFSFSLSVNFLDLGSISVCASTSPQVSPRLACVMNLTQNLLCQSDKFLDVAALASLLC